jgi:hypothetical protein
MESHELLATFREDAVDCETPPMWSTKEVYRYINDAYFMFVRLTGGIADATSSVTTLTATAAQATTPIHKSILRIRTATNVTDQNRPLHVINVQDIENLTTEDYGVIYNVGSTTEPGPVRYMIIGEEEEYVRWAQIPTVNATIKLVVERLPLEAIVRERQRFTGVRDEHHYHLLKWVRHLAYRKQDSDTFDLVKSDQERDDFYDYCELAKKEKGIRKHKVRVVSYGGL